MIGIDTYVLVRVLVDDPGQPGQVEVARALVSRAGEVFIPLVVLVECVWVLETSYRLDRKTIASALAHLHQNSAYILEDTSLGHEALQRYRSGSADFADYVILGRCRRKGVELYTFDMRLAREEGVSKPAE